MAHKARSFTATAAVRNPFSAKPQAANAGNTGLNAARKAKGAPTVAIVKRNGV